MHQHHREVQAQGVKSMKRLFAEVCPDKAIGTVERNMWREPFRYWK